MNATRDYKSTLFAPGLLAQVVGELKKLWKGDGKFSVSATLKLAGGVSDSREMSVDELVPYTGFGTPLSGLHVSFVPAHAPFEEYESSSVGVNGFSSSIVICANGPDYFSVTSALKLFEDILGLQEYDPVGDLERALAAAAERENEGGPGPVFISHSSHDADLVNRLFDLLQTGCGLKTSDVFCTSVEGAGIETGEDFVKWIEERLAKASLVVLLLTPSYYESLFCVAEMGAAWALRRKVFPLMAPGVERGPKAVLLGRQTSRLDSPGLDALHDAVHGIFQTPGNTPRWTTKKTEFLSGLPALGQEGDSRGPS